MLLRETPSSRARTLTFSPASIRRRASSLNSRLNRLGSLVVKPVLLPRKENCHHFPCLKLGVHSITVTHLPGRALAVAIGGSKRRSATSRYPLQTKRHFAIGDTPAKRLAPAAERKAAICCSTQWNAVPNFPPNARRGRQPWESEAKKQSCRKTIPMPSGGSVEPSTSSPYSATRSRRGASGAVVEPRGGRNRSTAAQDDGVSSPEQPRRARLLRMRSADRQIQSRLRAVATGGHTAPSDQYPR